MRLYNRLISKSYLTTLLAAGVLTASCGKKSSDDSSGVSTTLRLSMVSSGKGQGTSLTSLKAVDSTQFENGQIGSGAPDEMSVSITKMTLSNSKTNASTPIFVDSAGKEISITGSRVDLSNLFTKISCIDSSGNPVTVPDGKTCKCGTKSDGTLIDLQADGSCPQPATGDNPAFGVMEVNQTGEFDTLTVDFLNKGTANGCITGKFKNDTTRTYCTKTDHGLDSSTSYAKSDFEAASGTSQTIYWSKSGSGEASLTKSFSIDGGITLSATDSPKLTMVIDRGRMLRFFLGTSGESAPNPGMPTGKAYFFSTVFEDSLYIFAGQPGDILGYQFAAYGAHNQSVSATVPSPVTACTSDCKYVNGWMTIIKDVSGAPMVASLMPDDDNAWTILKGANYDPATPGKVLKDKLTVNSSTSWDIGYNLMESGKTTGLVGTVYGLDPTKAVDTTQTITFSSKNDGTSTTQFATWGEISLTRGL